MQIRFPHDLTLAAEVISPALEHIWASLQDNDKEETSLHICDLSPAGLQTPNTVFFCNKTHTCVDIAPIESAITKCDFD